MSRFWRMIWLIGTISCVLVSGRLAASGSQTRFPLSVSANGRYLIDRQGAPFLINEDIAARLDPSHQ